MQKRVSSLATCKHCSAPLPSKSIICDYCGVRNDIDLKKKNIGLKLPKSKRTCPDCMTYLDSVDVGKNSRFIIEQCERCFGLFFDNHELERLLEQSVSKSYFVDHHKLHSLLQHPLHKDVILYRKCPQCSKIMQRKNHLGRSGVIVDACVEHGVWLDAGELKQIQEWTALGGKRNALKDELDDKHRHNRAVNRKRSRKSTHKHIRDRSKHYFDDIVDTVSSIFGKGMHW